MLGEVIGKCKTSTNAVYIKMHTKSRKKEITTWENLWQKGRKAVRKRRKGAKGKRKYYFPRAAVTALKNRMV
jgi:hypothetical protein